MVAASLLPPPTGRGVVIRSHLRSRREAGAGTARSLTTSETRSAATTSPRKACCC
uniref:Uncharacterized protein n=1 Tax=Arundo donax TaxID=35708 RepID=A0A0A9C9F9_ARUDO